MGAGRRSGEVGAAAFVGFLRWFVVGVGYSGDVEVKMLAGATCCDIRYGFSVRCGTQIIVYKSLQICSQCVVAIFDMGPKSTPHSATNTNTTPTI